jgi:dTDP-4-amino-4,6-dideoxygalactose transaminase
MSSKELNSAEGPLAQGGLHALRPSSEDLAVEGGRPIRTLPWPTYDKGDAYLDMAHEEALLRAYRSRRLFRYDTRAYAETECGRFESRLRELFESPHALACSSGTAAIALGLMAAGLQPGDHVACPAFTFSATPSAIVLAGGVPVIIDVDDDLHLDLEDLRRKITPRMKAVVVVHMRGFASDVTALCELCRAHDLFVVEDAVPACGVRLAGQRLGTFGRAGAFSMQSDKSLNTGEGGFVLFQNAEDVACATVLSGAYEGRGRAHATFERFDDLMLPLYNFRLDELRAALANAQIEQLDAKVARHQAIYREVARGMEELGLFRVRRPVREDDGFLGECINFQLRGGTVESTRWFCRALRTEGIELRQLGDANDTNVRCFWNWRFLWPDRSVESIRTEAPRAARLLPLTLDVPLSACLTAEDREDLIAALAKVGAAYSLRFGGAR